MQNNYILQINENIDLTAYRRNVIIGMVMISRKYEVCLLRKKKKNADPLL